MGNLKLSRKEKTNVSIIAGVFIVGSLSIAALRNSVINEINDRIEFFEENKDDPTVVEYEGVKNQRDSIDNQRDIYRADFSKKIEELNRSENSLINIQDSLEAVLAKRY